MRIPSSIACGLLVVGAPAFAQSGAACPEPAGPGIIDHYCYDSRGRLIEQRRSDGQTSLYSYDDANNRTSSTVEGGTPNLTVVPIGGRPIPIILPGH